MPPARRKAAGEQRGALRRVLGSGRFLRTVVPEWWGRQAGGGFRWLQADAEPRHPGWSDEEGGLYMFPCA